MSSSLERIVGAHLPYATRGCLLYPYCQYTALSRNTSDPLPGFFCDGLWWILLGSYFISLPRSRWHSWQLPPSWHEFVFHFSLCTLSWFSFSVSGYSSYYVLWAHFLQLVFSLLLFLRVLFPMCSHEIFLAAFDFHHLSMSWLPSGNLQVPSLSLTVLKTWHEGVPQSPKGQDVPGWALRHACPWVFPFVDGHCCPPSVLSWCLGIIYHFPSSSGYIRTMPPPAVSPVWMFFYLSSLVHFGLPPPWSQSLGTPI